MQGAISVLVKYTAMVQEHVHQVLAVAAAVAAHSGWHFCLAAHALSGTLLGFLLCVPLCAREREQKDKRDMYSAVIFLGKMSWGQIGTF